MILFACALGAACGENDERAVPIAAAVDALTDRAPQTTLPRCEDRFAAAEIIQTLGIDKKFGIDKLFPDENTLYY